MTTWVKDPLDTAWYQFNWASFLAPLEVITAHTTGVDANLTKLSDTATNTTVSVQVTGGLNGVQSLVTCNIHTSAGNIYETSKYIVITTRQS